MEIISKGFGNSKRYLDQIDNSTWIYGRSLANYLLVKYGLTIESYYNLITFGSSDYKPKCPYCDRPLKWNNPNAMSGYSSTCGNLDCIKLCKLESFDESIALRKSDPNYVDFCKSISDRVKKLHVDGVYDYENSINSKLGKINRHYSNLLNLDNNKLTHLYLVEFDDYIKFGVTQDLNNRSKFYGRKLEVMYSGNLNLVAEIERNIKLNLIDGSEYQLKVDKDHLINIINAVIAQLIEH